MLGLYRGLLGGWNIPDIPVRLVPESGISPFLLVSARKGELHRGFTGGWERFHPGFYGETGELMGDLCKNQACFTGVMGHSPISAGITDFHTPKQKYHTSERFIHHPTGFTGFSPLSARNKHHFLLKTRELTDFNLLHPWGFTGGFSTFPHIRVVYMQGVHYSHTRVVYVQGIHYPPWYRVLYVQGVHYPPWCLGGVYAGCTLPTMVSRWCIYRVYYTHHGA